MSESGARTLAIAAVQPQLDSGRLADPELFRSYMDSLALQASATLGRAEHRLLVFPEGLGQLAVLAFVPAAARGASRARALGLLAAARPLVALGSMVRHGTVRPERAALLAACPAARQLIYRTFSVIARRYRAVVVAGTFLRVADDGHLYRSSYTFDADGLLCATTDKVNLVPGIDDARPGGVDLTRGNPGDVPIVRVPWGTLATVIGYDGDSAALTSNERFVPMVPVVDAAGADVIANPSAVSGEQWRTTDRAAASLSSTLAGARCARFGVSALLTGRVQDRDFRGRSVIVERFGDDLRVLARADSDSCESIVHATVALPGEALQ